MSASPSPRLSTSPPAAFSPDPITPDSTLRARTVSSSPNESQNSASLSTAFSDSGLSSRLTREASRSSFRMGTPIRKILVRSDAALLTCFDPADKELYDLWAPKK
ncbi:uncharacterized protein BT62DRAFT_1002679 [Guyanagaster necrorhizus]|uniref:Uncharacterized protein n=1 Tax=Guyanagaster necrorhizus TaxID=856835 RepID=A0A9P8AVI8_9AGAR|nr:uncharacterized protein BT62DRAFT_1002679 [Guyanagaster necrorhizus MCA 3950]KAG7449136.1 hypothetical protein BT62DRAFT_1002679 [Guyanagaster necrorhizus MCA 3950]